MSVKGESTEKDVLVETKPTIRQAIEQIADWRNADKAEIVKAVSAQLSVKPDSIKSMLLKMLKQPEIKPPEGTPPDPTISVCMIVRDGADFLDRSLASTQPIANEVILHIDDRTTDNTAEIGEKYGAKISYFKWTDDFSDARNQSIALATGDWIMIMDHDHVLDPAAIPEIKMAVCATNIDYLSFMIWHHTRDNGLSVMPSPRIFRRGNVEYADIIHNQVSPEGNYIMMKHPIHHYGFNLSPEKMAAKHARTERMLLIQLKKRPNYMFAYANLCRCYRQQGRNEEVVVTAKKALALPEEHQAELPCLATLIDLTWAYLALKQPERALETANRALTSNPGNLDALMYAAHACSLQEGYKQALELYHQYLQQLHIQQKGSPNTGIQIDTFGAKSVAYGNMADCYEKIGDHKRALAASFRAAQEDRDNPAALKPLIGKYIQATAATRIAANKPRVLFIQRIPCIRALKEATALSKYGIEVGLAYQIGTANDHYNYGDELFCELYPIKQGMNLPLISETIFNAAEGYDLVHFHNEPDGLTVSGVGALMGIMPVVHDVHDIVSERNPDSVSLGWMEKMACYGADGIVVVSNIQYEHLQAKYKLHKTPFALVRSAVPAAMLPKERKEKLSVDGDIHLVYEGGLRVGGGHRDCIQFFTDLASHGYHIHIYPANDSPEYRELAEGNEHLHYYDPLPPDKLLTELTQYDAGLIPLTVEDNPALRFAKDCSLPNKIFEYLACGLPVAARNLRQLTLFIEEQKCGIVFDSVDELASQMDDLLAIQIGEDKTFTMEEEVKKLIALYMRLLKPQSPELPKSKAAVMQKVQAKK